MSTFQDELGLSLTCSAEAAASAYRRGVDAYLHAWPGAREAVEEAVRHDPAFALAHALRALDAATHMRRAEVREAIELAQLQDRIAAMVFSSPPQFGQCCIVSSVRLHLKPQIGSPRTGQWGYPLMAGHCRPTGSIVGPQFTALRAFEPT